MKEEHLKPYQQYLEELTRTFDRIECIIILKAQNQFADALDTLAFMVEIPKEYGHDIWSLNRNTK